MKNQNIISGSLVLLITFNLFNLLNLVYNVLMARFLSIEDYGSLTFLIYIVIIFAIFTESIQTIISKYSTLEKDDSKLKSIIKKAFKKSIKYSLIIFSIFLIVSIPLSIYSKTQYYPLFTTGLTIFLSFMVPINRGVMQGRKLFSSLGLNMVVEGAIKLSFSILFVLLGWKVFGAVLGVISGMIVALLISFISLSKVFKQQEKQAITPNIYAYSKPVFVLILTLIAFLSLDIILAKILFNSQQAGIYSLASTIAKILFIGTQPIGRVMFPLTTESKNSKPIKLFSKAILLISGISLVFVLLIYLFADQIIFIYSGKQIEQAANILFLLSLSYAFLSLTNLSLLYKLSRNSYKNYLFMPLILIVQIIVLYISKGSLYAFSEGLLAVTIIFLMASFLLKG